MKTTTQIGAALAAKAAAALDRTHMLAMPVYGFRGQNPWEMSRERLAGWLDGVVDLSETDVRRYVRWLGMVRA